MGTDDRIASLEARIEELTKALQQGNVPKIKPTGKTIEGVVRTEKELIVPDRLVRGNASEYRKFRELAESEGIALRLVDDKPVKPSRPMPASFENDRAIYVARPVLNGDSQEYQHWKRKAEQAGKRLIVANSSSEMPEDAFND